MQLLASLIAPLFTWAITGRPSGPGIAGDVSQWQAFLAETLWTFFLCTTVLVFISNMNSNSQALNENSLY